MDDRLAVVRLCVMVFVELAAAGLVIYAVLRWTSKRRGEGTRRRPPKPKEVTPEQVAGFKAKLKDMAISKAIEWTLFPLLGVVWKCRGAPEGTTRHLVWMLALCFVGALVMWILLSLADRRINGPNLQVPKSVEDTSTEAAEAGGELRGRELQSRRAEISR